MTVIRPLTNSEIALKEYVSSAAKKAKLNLSETMALNKTYGLDLEYTPSKDTVELTHYRYKEEKLFGKSNFARDCEDVAAAIADTTGASVKVKNKYCFSTNLEANLKSAMKKMKKALK